MPSTKSIIQFVKIDERLPNHLTPNERKALKMLVSNLHQRYGNDLRRVVLFGSKARGDFDEESDLDILVVLRFPDADYWQHWRQIVNESYDIELEQDVVFSTLIRNEASYEQLRQANLLIHREIERDGIILWTAKNEPSFT